MLFNKEHTDNQNNDNLELNESPASSIQFPSIVSPYFATSEQKPTENGFANGSAVCTGGGPLAQFIIHVMPADQEMSINTSNIENSIKQSIKQSIELAELNCENFPRNKQLTIVFPLIYCEIFRERVKKDISLAQLIMKTATFFNNSREKPLNLMFVDVGNDTGFSDEFNNNKIYSCSKYKIDVKNGNIFEILKVNPENYILVNPYHSNVDKTYGQFLSNGGLTKSIINELNQYNVILSNKEVKTAAECIYDYIFNQYEALCKSVEVKTDQYLNSKFEKITFFGAIYNFIKDTYLKIINALTSIFIFMRNTVFSQVTKNTNDDSKVTEENKSEISTISRIESQDSYDSNNSNDSKVDLQKIYQSSRVSTGETQVRMPYDSYIHNSAIRSNSDDSQQSLNNMDVSAPFKTTIKSYEQYSWNSISCAKELMPKGKNSNKNTLKN